MVRTTPLARGGIHMDRLTALFHGWKSKKASKPNLFLVKNSTTSRLWAGRSGHTDFELWYPCLYAAITQTLCTSIQPCTLYATKITGKIMICCILSLMKPAPALFTAFQAKKMLVLLSWYLEETSTVAHLQRCPFSDQLFVFSQCLCLFSCNSKPKLCRSISKHSGNHPPRLERHSLLLLQSLAHA